MWSRANLFDGTYGGQSGTGGRFFSEYFGLPIQRNSTDAPYSSAHYFFRTTGSSSSKQIKDLRELKFAQQCF
jgi:hypothetical protein